MGGEEGVLLDMVMDDLRPSVFKKKKMFSSARLLGGPAKRMLTKRCGRTPKLLSTEEAIKCSPLPRGGNFFVLWLGTVLYVGIPFNAVACIHRFNHFKKYGGGFK